LCYHAAEAEQSGENIGIKEDEFAAAAVTAELPERTGGSQTTVRTGSQVLHCIFPLWH